MICGNNLLEGQEEDGWMFWSCSSVWKNMPKQMRKKKQIWLKWCLTFGPIFQTIRICYCESKVFFFLTPFCKGRQPVFSVFITLLPGSVGLSPHLLGSPEPNSGCRSYFRQSRILTIRLPFVFKNTYPPRRAGNTLRVVSRLYMVNANYGRTWWEKQ